jgi:hypothetical protein
MEGLPADPSQFGRVNQCFPHNQPNFYIMQYQNNNDADFTRAARSIQTGGIFIDTIIM